MSLLNRTRPGLPEIGQQFGAGDVPQIIDLDRRQSRIKMVCPIRIWGTNTAGEPFNILAYTLNVSSSGARIGGIKVGLGVGDAVTIQYKRQRASFKIAWMGRPGCPTQEQAGVRLLDRNLLFQL
jgi:hypothetical protein